MQNNRLSIPHFLEEERKFLDFLFLRKSHLRFGFSILLAQWPLASLWLRDAGQSNFCMTQVNSCHGGGGSCFLPRLDLPFAFLHCQFPGDTVRMRNILHLLQNPLRIHFVAGARPSSGNSPCRILSALAHEPLKSIRISKGGWHKLALPD